MSIVASRYSEALLSLAKEKDRVNRYRQDMILVKDSLEDSGFRSFFASYRITKAQKKELITKAFSSLEKDCLNFLYLLCDHDRFIYIDEIAEEYIHLSNQELGYKEGILEVAHPLEKEVISQLEDSLSSDRKVILTQHVKHDLIRGFRIVFEDEVIDYSMKDKIRKLKESLKRKDVDLWN